MSSESSLIKFKKFFNLFVRKLHFLKYKKNFYLRKYNRFLNLGFRKSHLMKYKKNFCLRKYNSFLTLGLESPISWNIRKLFFEQNIRAFFRVDLFFWAKYKSFFQSRFIFIFRARTKKFYFLKYKKNFFLRKYKKVFNLRGRIFPTETFLILMLESSTFQNIWKTFF